MVLPLTNPTLLFFILVSVALLVPILCERVRVPSIVGLIVTGILLGPNAFGVLDRGELIALLGQAGLLFIVFVAGLQIDLVRFRKYRMHSAVFGVVSYLVPQVAGTMVAYYFLEFSLPSSILLGSMFGSHTLLAYPIAARLGIVQSIPVTTSVGGTIITDTSSLLVLAVVANSVTGDGDWAFWVTFAVFLVGYVGLVFFALPPLARWFYRYIPDEGARDFLFTILMVFLFAWLAEVIGLQPILGAFLCGIALNRLIPERSPLMSRIQFVGQTLLVPMFLLSVGMLVDPRALVGEWETIRIVIAMSITVVGAKLLGAFLAGKSLGYASHECWVLFGMTVSQAAATLAAVVVGYEIGLFNEAVVNGAIIMILVTTLVGPYCTEHWGRRIAEAMEHALDDPSDRGQRILLPLANPETVHPLVDLALLIREPALRTPIYPMVIVTEGREVDSQLASAGKLLEQATLRASSSDCQAHPISRVDVNIADGIRRTISEQQITTVVIGWSGPTTLARRIFGSVLDQLLAQSQQMVFVARFAGSLTSVRRIVLAIPESAEKEPNFEQTLHYIKVLCQQLSASLLILGPAVGTPRFQSAVRATRPETKTVFQEIPKLRTLPTLLEQYLESDDLLMLLSARSHRLSWAPSLEVLPGQIARAHPDHSLLIVYPPDYE